MFHWLISSSFIIIFPLKSKMSEKWNCYYISVQAYNTVIYVTCRIILPHYKKVSYLILLRRVFSIFHHHSLFHCSTNFFFYFNKGTFKGKQESFLRSHKLCNILWIDSTLQIKHLRENKLFVEECRLPAVSPIVAIWDKMEHKRGCCWIGSLFCCKRNGIIMPFSCETIQAHLLPFYGL